MQISKAKMIELFNTEYLNTVHRKFSDEGLNLLIDQIERQEANETVKLNYTPQDLYENYWEESLEEFVAFYDIELNLDSAQSKAEERAIMKSAIEEYLENRDAFVGFTTTNRVVYCSDKAG